MHLHKTVDCFPLLGEFVRLPRNGFVFSRNRANAQARVIHHAFCRKQKDCAKLDGTFCPSLAAQAQKFRFINHRHGQFFRLGQLAPRRLARHHIVGFFADGADHLAARRFDACGSLVPF